MHTWGTTHLHTRGTYRTTCEVKELERRRGQGQRWGGLVMERACFSLGTAGPGAQKNFDPEHPLAGDSKGRSLALALCFLILFCLCCVSSHYVSRTHPPTFRRHFCPRARHEMLYGLRRKKEQSLSAR